ncbi:hypothetical protein HLB42_20480 (plasmid) [Deinococcus sp. D7000]|nr:hypothetical protein HLB42_20480 [Deinococcus sp. D7000]
MKRMILVMSGVLLTPSAEAAGGSQPTNLQKALVTSYLKQNNASDACGPYNLEIASKATFFPSRTEMYIYNAGALSYYSWQKNKAVRLWTATPVTLDEQTFVKPRKIQVQNSFIEWFKRGPGLKELYVINECGTLPADQRNGPLYQVRVRSAYQGTLTAIGVVKDLRRVAAQITRPIEYLYQR